jgi:hypothetical protein
MQRSGNEMTKITISNQSRKSKRKYKSENGRTPNTPEVGSGAMEEHTRSRDPHICVNLMTRLLNIEWRSRTM